MCNQVQLFVGTRKVSLGMEVRKICAWLTKNFIIQMSFKSSETSSSPQIQTNNYLSCSSSHYLLPQTPLCQLLLFLPSPASSNLSSWVCGDCHW
ncbi:hypothetical protein Y1Q_0005200 [Alligator mississippiensis]|uniref:Uncharacterized protein n=1 Tax=Alligator mississippiensis TaxID=8496 RepID=A0A151MT01_ALLMI|nr:hypothetical protein Y1Q_0005200 [Alligator mississippiensis]